MQPDPILYGDGMNIYAYAGNDPINGIDPTGTCSTGSRTGSTSGLCTSFAGSSCLRSVEEARAQLAGEGGARSRGSPGGSAIDSRYGGDKDLILVTATRTAALNLGGQSGLGDVINVFGSRQTGSRPSSAPSFSGDEVVVVAQRPAWLDGLDSIDLSFGLVGQDADYAYLTPEGPVIVATRKRLGVTRFSSTDLAIGFVEARIQQRDEQICDAVNIIAFGGITVGGWALAIGNIGGKTAAGWSARRVVGVVIGGGSATFLASYAFACSHVNSRSRG